MVRRPSVDRLFADQLDSYLEREHMPRAATGTVIAKPTRQGVTFALRFRAYGERRCLTLGTDRGGGRARSPRTRSRSSWPRCAAARGKPPAPDADVEIDPRPHVPGIRLAVVDGQVAGASPRRSTKRTAGRLSRAQMLTG